ncbi:MAG: NACHT domain-containing protein [Phormidesmis sp.]
MASFTLFALKVLAPTLAKSLVKAFDIKSDLSNEVLGALVDVTAGEVLVSRADKATLEKRTAAIANQMAADIRPLFLYEGRQISQNAQNAIMLGVYETLTKARLSQGELVDMSFDVDRLTQHLLSSNPQIERDFEANEQSIYRQAIEIVSERLIEAAPQTDGFTLSTETKKLQQLEKLVKQIELKRRQASQAKDKFIGRYRAIVQDELDRLEVFGIKRDALTAKQRLSMAYITLSVSGKSDKHDRPHFILNKLEQADKESRRVLRQVDEAICEQRRIVIRGGAGAGKSTLMQWLAVRAASQKFEKNLTHWNLKVPFFIRLRSLVGREFPTPENFPSLIAQNIAAQMPEEWVHKYMENGEALILIDGVDELPRKERKSFFLNLKALVRDFPSATYIITSRPSGLKSAQGEEWDAWESWVTDKKFVNLTLEPMNANDVQAFITSWHKALPENARTVDASQDPSYTENNLKRQIKQRRELQQLASTPLLCAMLCALHRENRTNLPSARLQLYSECIDMLLNKRDEGRDIVLDDCYPKELNESQKIELLWSLALKLMRLNLSSLDTDRVDYHFDQELKQMSLPSTVTGQKLRTFFVERTALLREPIIGQIDFAHRTFQEYLAARAILNDDSFEELLQKAADDQWREAIVVAAGLARAKERTKLLETLIEQGNASDEHRHYLHLLSVACLETTTKVDPAVRSRVLNCAKALMPPKDKDEVAMVIRAGNEVISALRYDSAYSADEATRCINALVGIGTNAAMEAIVDYAKVAFELEQYTVSRAIGKGWDVFEQTSYLKKVLTQLSVLYLA